MKWIHRSAPWLALCLATIAGLLAWKLWRLTDELDSCQLASTAQIQRLSELQTQATQLKAKPTPTESKLLAASPKDDSSPPASQDPKLLEASREVAQLAALREKQLFRRNALRGYKDGLDALHLPTQNLEQAKQIILTIWETRDVQYKQVKTMEERKAIAEKMAKTEASQLTDLLGKEAYENLKASQFVSSLDWTLGTDLWDGGAPLTKDQLRAIALAQVKGNLRKSRWPAPADPSEITDSQSQLSTQDTALLAATASSLSPAQQEILRRSLIEENQYNAAMRGFQKEQQQLWKAQNPGGD